MESDMITDVTLDHLPDLSDTSISFQIPSDNNTSADLLLADHDDALGLINDPDPDDDVSFAPVAPTFFRGRPLTLHDLTPRVQVAPRSHSPSPTPAHLPSAKPSVIHPPLSLGHGTLAKHRNTPSRANSRQPQPESPLVSSERFRQLRAEMQTLGQPHDSPLHIRACEDPQEGALISSHAPSNLANIVPNLPLLDPLPEEEETHPVQQTAQDVVMDTGDGCPADAINIATPRPKSKRNPRTSVKPALAAGRVSKRPTTHKPKSIPPHDRRGRSLPPIAVRQSTPPQSIAIDTAVPLVPPACAGGNTDSKPDITHPSTGGLAERLVSYSQKLISSIGLYKQDSFIEASADAVSAAPVETRSPPATTLPSLSPQRVNEAPKTHCEPFRLSEISPHKSPSDLPRPSSPALSGTLQDGVQHAISPMRLVKKRISTDADPSLDHHRRKRGRTSTDTGAGRGSPDEALSQAQSRTAKANHVHGPPAKDTQPSQSTLPAARTKYKPKLTGSSLCKGPTLNAFPYSSSSRQVREPTNKGKGRRDTREPKAAGLRPGSSLGGFSASSRPRKVKKTRHENVTKSLHARQQSGLPSISDLPLIEKPTATLSVAPLTKPVGFTFRVDARLEARKAEERLAMSEPGKTHPLHPVPEFRSHRASQHAAFTFQREGVVPSVPPVPFFFCTEQRAKEREKFDEMVKRKEEEMQRLKEEERRREMEEEERAIKVLRRKAIPKANEIPEWYADMPKRKGVRM